MQSLKMRFVMGVLIIIVLLMFLECGASVDAGSAGRSESARGIDDKEQNGELRVPQTGGRSGNIRRFPRSAESVCVPEAIPTAMAGTLPGAVPGIQPGAVPGVQPGVVAVPGAVPGCVPGAVPGAQPGAQPGVQPGVIPAGLTGAKHEVVREAVVGFLPRTLPRALPGVVPGAVPGAQPGVVPSTGAVAVPGAVPGVVPGAVPGAQPGVVPGAVPGAQPGVVPSTGAVAVPGVVPGVVPGAQPEVVRDAVVRFLHGAQRGAVPGAQPGVEHGRVAGGGSGGNSGKQHHLRVKEFDNVESIVQEESHVENEKNSLSLQSTALNNNPVNKANLSETALEDKGIQQGVSQLQVPPLQNGPVDAALSSREASPHNPRVDAGGTDSEGDGGKTPSHVTPLSQSQLHDIDQLNSAVLNNNALPLNHQHKNLLYEVEAASAKKPKHTQESNLAPSPLKAEGELDLSKKNSLPVKAGGDAMVLSNISSQALPLVHPLDKADGSLGSSSLFALAALATLAVAAAAPAH